MATTNPMKEYWRNQQRKVTATPATDTSKLFAMPEQKSHLNSGHYYRKDGSWLFSIEKSEDVYVYKDGQKILTAEEITDPLNKKNEFDITDYSKSFTNNDFVKLSVLAIELLMLAGLAYKEEPNKEGKYAIAFAVKNKWEKRKIKNLNETFTQTFNSLNTYNGYNSLHEKMLDIRKPYKTFFSTSPIERNKIDKMRWGIEGAINAFIDNGFDYSNEATGWQGVDIYFKVEGSSAKEHMEESGYEWVDNPLIGEDARFSQTTYPSKANPQGKYLYLITASYGNGIIDGVISGTIFTKSKY